MIYKEPIDNISVALQVVGTIRRDQLLMMFRDTGLMDHEILFLLSQLVFKHNVKYNAENFTYSFVGGASYNDEMKKKYMKAFWVIAWMGSSHVKELFIPRYPTQFFVIREEGDETSDITIVDTAHDALLAQRVRSEYNVEIKNNKPDIVKHIAVIRRKSDVKLLEGCGFDSYCIIDPLTGNVTSKRLGEC